jgi:hypothetical protein
MMRQSFCFIVLLSAIVVGASGPSTGSAVDAADIPKIRQLLEEQIAAFNALTSSPALLNLSPESTKRKLVQGRRPSPCFNVRSLVGHADLAVKAI